ncbi:hypothetical protein Micbo1qcDRAFT_234002 [Microdochium bolleyi]|uniref:Apple domain-containing protein n=1 Tax=Microdochium bolleyi TaxID=196109 RepID=A0A136J345_9PEZI|nr:hypothetical protein Micbo1qcDRAFT_234002 [Microdochium bolleyi]
MDAAERKDGLPPDPSARLRLDPGSQLPEVYMQSTLPEAVVHSTLPEAVPADDYHHHQYQHQQQQQQKYYQDQEQKQWLQSPTDGSTNTYTESQGGWTSVSQRGPNPLVAEGERQEAKQEDDKTHKTILGLRRRKFWLIIGPLLLILAMGLAVGLGVGLSARSSSGGGGSTASAPAAAPTPVACPAANGTVYTQTAADGGASFLVVCNVDYNGNDPGSGTTDLTNMASVSVEDCMKSCAATRDCAGAWFGDYYGRKCFLKSTLGVSHVSKNSFFVIKQKG